MVIADRDSGVSDEKDGGAASSRRGLKKRPQHADLLQWVVGSKDRCRRKEAILKPVGGENWPPNGSGEWPVKDNEKSRTWKSPPNKYTTT